MINLFKADTLSKFMEWKEEEEGKGQSETVDEGRSSSNIHTHAHVLNFFLVPSLGRHVD
jgi:hypothetical protein